MNKNVVQSDKSYLLTVTEISRGTVKEVFFVNRWCQISSAKKNLPNCVRAVIWFVTKKVLSFSLPCYGFQKIASELRQVSLFTKESPYIFKNQQIQVCKSPYFDERMSVFHSLFNPDLPGKTDYCQTGRLSGRIFLIMYYN